MPLPAPNLDDRRFQDLVDEAKRRVQQRCPEWTDHNVSDPGVTLIELFAWMTEQVVYRLNRTPDLNYLKFLDLIDVRLFPPTAARCDVTFWLSSPRESSVRVVAGAEVATERSEGAEPVVFATTSDLEIVPCSLSRVASSIHEPNVRDHTAAAQAGDGFYPFAKVPRPGDMLYAGLSEPAPSCAVSLRFECRSEGVGVDPLNPPLVWEAWDGRDWARCRLEQDGTGGLNRTGEVVVHLPVTHAASLVGNQRAGWIRCRVVESEEHQPAYSASPRVFRVEAATVGGTAPAVHAETIAGELIGVAEGVAGERLALRRQPVVPRDTAHVLHVGGEEGWEEWSEVESFARSGEGDKHFVLDAAAGEIVIGPAVRERDGSVRRYGATPQKGAVLKIAEYRTGGGRRGNVAPNALVVLRSSIPYVASVRNGTAARGGVDGETVENAKLRGALALRTGDRAVTAEDYERVAREAAPEVARVRAVPADDVADSGVVRVLVVPAAGETGGRIRFDALVPTEAAVERISRELDDRRVIGARILIEPPVYQGITIVAKLRARAKVDPTALQNGALEALYRHFSPLTGGEDGTGWPFGRPVALGEVYSVLQGVRGAELVEDCRLFAADPRTGERGSQIDRIDLPPHSLVFSYEHRVLVDGT